MSSLLALPESERKTALRSESVCGYLGGARGSDLARRLAHMMPQTLLMERFVEQDQYQKPVYGVGVSYVARVVGKHRLVRVQGPEVVSTHTVYLGVAVEMVV